MSSGHGRLSRSRRSPPGDRHRSSTCPRVARVSRTGTDSGLAASGRKMAPGALPSTPVSGRDIGHRLVVGERRLSRSRRRFIAPRGWMGVLARHVARLPDAGFDFLHPAGRDRTVDCPHVQCLTALLDPEGLLGFGRGCLTWTSSGCRERGVSACRPRLRPSRRIPCSPQARPRPAACRTWTGCGTGAGGSCIPRARSREGCYVGDLLHGEWTLRDAEGRIVARVRWRLGRSVGSEPMQVEGAPCGVPLPDSCRKGPAR